MRSPFVLGALAVCLSGQPGLALDAGSQGPATVSPDQAGRQGRQELEALMAKQQADKAALAPAAYTVPPPPSRANDRREIKAMDGRIPTICDGC